MEIEFLEQGHIYLKNGIIVPSVSEILRFIFPNKYDGIPKSILDAKADFGTHIHEAIENYENKKEVELSPMEMITFNRYLHLKRYYKIKPIEQEKLVSYGYRFCGRLDMIALIGNEFGLCLVDVKTTSKIDTEYLSWQLGFYKLAHEAEYKMEFKKCYCLWLPKRDLGNLVEITPKTEEEIEEVLHQYESNRQV